MIELKFCNLGGTQTQYGVLLFQLFKIPLWIYRNSSLFFHPIVTHITGSAAPNQYNSHNHNNSLIISMFMCYSFKGGAHEFKLDMERLHGLETQYQQNDLRITLTQEFFRKNIVWSSLDEHQPKRWNLSKHSVCFHNKEYTEVTLSKSSGELPIA